MVSKTILQLGRCASLNLVGKLGVWYTLVRRSMATITALICALNEEKRLPSVLPRIPDCVDEVILVDGHSTDRTVEVARELCPGIRILYQPGRGKGDALRHGIEHARGDIIVTMDADGSTDPEEVPRFIEPFA